MLPEILPIAEKHGLMIDERSRNKREVRAKCPFCKEDSKPGKKRKFYLSLNTEDQVYKCWYCGESGGVFRFISLLENVPESLVMERYRRKVTYTHPVERLTRTQLKLIGIEFKVRWADLRKYDRTLYEKFRKEVWQRWNKFMEAEKYFAFRRLVMGIRCGNYQKAVSIIKKRELEIGVSLLEPVLLAYSMNKRPQWAREAEESANLFLYALRKRGKKNEESSKTCSLQMGGCGAGKSETG